MLENSFALLLERGEGLAAHWQRFVLPLHGLNDGAGMEAVATMQGRAPSPLASLYVDLNELAKGNPGPLRELTPGEGNGWQVSIYMRELTCHFLSVRLQSGVTWSFGHIPIASSPLRRECYALVNGS